MPKKLPGYDMVFISPLEISEDTFQIRMDKIWFCKLLLLFKIHTKDRHRQSVQWVLLCVCARRVHRHTKTRSYFAYWIYSAYSDMLINHSLGRTVSFCNHLQSQWTSTSLYVIQVSYTLELLPLVPVGSTGTIPFARKQELPDFPTAFCNKSAQKWCM